MGQRRGLIESKRRLGIWQMHKQVLQASQGYVYCVEGEIRDANSWRKFLTVSSETFDSLIGDGVFRRLPAKSDGQFAYPLSSSFRRRKFG